MNPFSAALIPVFGFTILKIADSLGHKNVSASAESQTTNKDQAFSNSRDTAMKLCAAY